jgi:hypothetical protein
MGKNLQKNLYENSDFENFSVLIFGVPNPPKESKIVQKALIKVVQLAMRAP